MNETNGCVSLLAEVILYHHRHRDRDRRRRRRHRHRHHHHLLLSTREWLVISLWLLSKDNMLSINSSIKITT